jgi:acetone carboxylase gamma subunit
LKAVPPGYPVAFNFRPDLDTFHAEWLGEPLPPTQT